MPGDALPTCITLDPGMCPPFLATDILASKCFFDRAEASDHRRAPVNSNLHLGEHPGLNNVISRLQKCKVVGLGKDLTPGRNPGIFICRNLIMEGQTREFTLPKPSGSGSNRRLSSAFLFASI